MRPGPSPGHTAGAHPDTPSPRPALRGSHGTHSHGLGVQGLRNDPQEEALAPDAPQLSGDADRAPPHSGHESA